MDEREQMAPAAVEGEPLYNEEGVDLTKIRYMLSLTPARRVRLMEDFINEVIAFRARRSRNEVSRDSAHADVAQS